MKFTTSDILFMIFIGPIPPSFLKGPKLPETPSEKFEANITETGTPIPILFGKRRIKSPILVWYGDVKIIKEKTDASGKK